MLSPYGFVERKTENRLEKSKFRTISEHIRADSIPYVHLNVSCHSGNAGSVGLI
mgnify:CR=1 FL=1